MKIFQAYFLLILLSIITTSTAALLNYSKPGCQDTCGTVKIPYPFGIGAKCAINEWYIIDCKSSKPYLSALNHQELLHVSLENQTVTVNAPTISHCQTQGQNGNSTSSSDLGGSPFVYSKTRNKFVLEGCGNALILCKESVLTGCSSSCLNNSVYSERNNFGLGSCQATVPYHLKRYTMKVIGLRSESLVADGGCATAFLVDVNSYLEGNFSDQSYVPISLLWTLTDSDINEAPCNHQPVDFKRLNLDLGATSKKYWKSYMVAGFKGNPYFSFGCNVTDECSRCKASGRICHFDDLYDGDGSISQSYFSCRSGANKSSTLGIILGVSICIGLFCLTAIIYALYMVIKKTKAKRQRERFFKRNGGLLLKQQEEANPSFFDKTILFTSHELEKATDYFNENRILGRGGQGTVYKGMLVDGRIVAVKKSKVIDESQVEQFINEVVILSQVNHRNVVKLLGCCLETEVPLLVSEFISNGTLYDRIHNETDEVPISFNLRLQIATEVAGALAYLHSATSIPIYHRDVKTTNILLDDKYRAKVSDFGTSRFVSIDQTHLTTLVKGTFGYLDPEYFQSSQFTEKSDVYSFGVVLVELLTGERPISLTRFGENKSLATHFMSAMEERRVMSIVDAIMIMEGTRDELLAIANVAMRCLNWNGKNRPTMKEVAVELETMRMSHIPSMVQTNIGQVIYEEDFSTLTYGDIDSSSTFTSFNDNISQ